LAPSGCPRRKSTYSRGVVHVFRARSSGRTWARGTLSTRVNMSEQSSGSERIALMEQLPTVTVVTPWRMDSESDGAARSSAS
jgi:hypothetical protein